MQDGRLSEGHARAVLMADGARARRELAERAVAEGLSVRQIEAAARGGSARAAASASRVASPRRWPIGRSIVSTACSRRRCASVGSAGSDEIVVELRFADEDALRRGLDRLG